SSRTWGTEPTDAVSPSSTLRWARGPGPNAAAIPRSRESASGSEDVSLLSDGSIMALLRKRHRTRHRGRDHLPPREHSTSPLPGIGLDLARHHRSIRCGSAILEDVGVTIRLIDIRCGAIAA